MLPVGTILWAKNRPSDHNDHLHVEGVPKKTGTPPLKNPGMTDSVWEIFIALSEMFGKPKYFLDSGTADWSYMGWYNRRRIAGSSSWSQHAWSNAIDIGPYVGVKAQQKFYDFLTGVTPPPTPPEDDTMRFIEAKGETGPHVEYWQRIMMAIDVPWKPTAYGVWNAHSIEELQDLTGPGENLGPGEAAALHAKLAQSGSSGGLNDAQVRQIVSETGRTLFVEKGQPVVIRGS